MNFAVENFETVLPELQTLFGAHWDITKQEGEYDLDLDLYGKLAKAGTLMLITAREDGELVGYHVSIIHTSMHCRRMVDAYTDMFYLKEEHRAGFAGYNLIKFFRSQAIERGVDRIFMGSRDIDLSPIMKRLRFVQAETVYRYDRSTHAD